MHFIKLDLFSQLSQAPTTPIWVNAARIEAFWRETPFERKPFTRIKMYGDFNNFYAVTETPEQILTLIPPAGKYE